MSLDGAELLQASERAMGRAAALAHEDLKRGLNALATVASVAPLIGILGTLSAIACDTFVGIGTDKATWLGIVAEGLSRSMIPSALGLLVGLDAMWAHRRIRGELKDFDREMEDASLRLLNVLGRLRRRR